MFGKVFKTKYLGECQDLYLKTDVLLLFDVFETFISVHLKYYGLDPCHHFSSPGLSWDAMLKMTSTELQKLGNIDMHLFLEKGMRGGGSYISKRYSPPDKNNTIMYRDANNLYGWTVIQDLTHSDFKWLSNKKINEFDLNISESNLIGHILECDLQYSKELHDSHSDYPLCIKKIEISNNVLSKYCSDIADKHKIKVGGVKTLTPNLGDEVKYVVNYKNLQYYLLLGMKLVKIHRILSFRLK